MDQPAYLEAYFKKAENCLFQLRTAPELSKVEIVTSQHTDPEKRLEYFEKSQVFNTRLQQNPLAIVYCTEAKEVAAAYKIAINNEIPIRVRAGGHDHEGESSGTNVVIIDVSKMDKIEVGPKIARIGAGNRFKDLTPVLAKQNVMIAHGTCATVCITGFTLGGGWGPWTRRMGMNCEHLKGATLMLGNGEIVDVDEDEKGNVPDLLWALRGGGGLSYGIVTELRIKTFELPKELIKFELHWNEYDSKEEYPANDHSTYDILTAWENIIQATDTPQLIGTNLKINARPPVPLFDYLTVSHNCCMYGYWEGDIDSLEAFVIQRFATVMPSEIKVEKPAGSDYEYISLKDSTTASRTMERSSAPRSAQALYLNKPGLMSHWDRESFAKVSAKLNSLERGTPIPPDNDQPAPHKITSRLVNKGGLGQDGYRQLLLSLTSPLVFAENRRLGLFTYVTLGAIVGEYYQGEKGQNNPAAFPYKDKLYTIQYQTWWNEADDKQGYPEPSQRGEVYQNINHAMDWIDTSRNFDIPNTAGSFISFKDIAVPTTVYFDKSYARLKEIKEKYVKDPDNHLRTRKTII